MTVAQARDAASIIKAMGVENAVVLGRSGGDVIDLKIGYVWICCESLMSAIIRVS